MPPEIKLEKELFNFEKLDVYIRAEDFADEILTLSEGFDNFIYNNIKNQLIRASNSIHLNIAEGGNNSYKYDKIRYYKIARGSVFESVSALRFIKRRGLIDDSKFNVLYHECFEISKMISGLIKHVNESWKNKNK
jgi:four helix bundle protein